MRDRVEERHRRTEGGGKEGGIKRRKKVEPKVWMERKNRGGKDRPAESHRGVEKGNKGVEGVKRRGRVQKEWEDVKEKHWEGAGSCEKEGNK